LKWRYPDPGQNLLKATKTATKKITANLKLEKPSFFAQIRRLLVAGAGFEPATFGL